MGSTVGEGQQGGHVLGTEKSKRVTEEVQESSWATLGKAWDVMLRPQPPSVRRQLGRKQNSNKHITYPIRHRNLIRT